MTRPSQRCTAFAGHDRIASGELLHVAMKAKQAYDADPARPVRVFDDADGCLIGLDLSAGAAEIVQRLNRGEVPVAHAEDMPAKRGRGRPRLGVVAREITLLPRHWQWLNAQPGGASLALRILAR